MSLSLLTFEYNQCQVAINGGSHRLSLFKERFVMRVIEPLLKVEDVMRILGLSRVSIYRKVSEARAGNGRFPLPIGDAKQKLRWNADDVEAFCQSRSMAPMPVMVTSPKQQRPKKQSYEQRQASARQALAERHGININPTK